MNIHDIFETMGWGGLSNYADKYAFVDIRTFKKSRNNSWPTRSEVAELDPIKKEAFRQRLHFRIASTKRKIKSLMDEDMRVRFIPVFDYMGDGYVMIWFKYRRTDQK